MKKSNIFLIIFFLISSHILNAIPSQKSILSDNTLNSANKLALNIKLETLAIKIIEDEDNSINHIIHLICTTRKKLTQNFDSKTFILLEQLYDAVLENFTIPNFVLTDFEQNKFLELINDLYQYQATQIDPSPIIPPYNLHPFRHPIICTMLIFLRLTLNPKTQLSNLSSSETDLPILLEDMQNQFQTLLKKQKKHLPKITQKNIKTLRKILNNISPQQQSILTLNNALKLTGIVGIISLIWLIIKTGSVVDHINNVTEKVNRAAQGAKELIATTKQPLIDATTNFGQAAHQIQESMAAIQPNIISSLEQIQQTTAQIQTVIGDIEGDTTLASAINSLQQTSQSVQGFVGNPEDHRNAPTLHGAIKAFQHRIVPALKASLHRINHPFTGSFRHQDDGSEPSSDPSDAEQPEDD